ncbi:RagB/SusD family nutrient uptake outer membrane protein [Flavobacterium salilacus subsp. salilacus]|uniref:RagB/SusD family nutrient uptake outer membrane protein n=1 Tax=Flavobacterium TaxID=237 RepID=UPI0010753F12|nr:MULTISPECIES: RagB/SusD family nutrient uptake outer membrane protein [Flavobacterium]KAF2514829.1 RagB/SusD family nutrient uptake outer membrane protein [Flavobacterium salilacus subsp. salilacus]MBE1615447.1 RagB/SusD family nutrient uptake outer membrane protein [Flavobacterium sp. SaA2.13]
MKSFNKKIILGISALVLLFFASCTDDLNTEPKVELSLENLLAKDPNAIQGLLSKMYGTFALSGPNGPGSSDISGPDPGETAFLRSIINLQDFTADGMKNRWGDDGLDQLTTTSNWDSNNKFFRYLYDRVYYIVPQTTNIILALESVEVEDEEQIVSELRFIRALAYYYMIDCFGKGVIVNETNYGNTTPLPEASRQELFEYVESELLAIEPDMPASNSYGRANKAVVRMLLAKLYLNAEVYTGAARYNDALNYSGLVINEGGYTLVNDFVSLFSADNDNSTEIIFPLIADPVVSQSFGNTTYIVNGSLSTETMPLAQFGATEGWTGHRATKAWYSLFGDLETSTDERAELFWTEGHNYEMEDYKAWADGYPSTKFRNSSYSGTTIATSFSPTDFPLYRLADAYLMYAECVLRGGGGNQAEALNYVNLVRSRSNATEISASELTLDFILDERARELNLEGHRRSDLIRFGKFSGGTYLWPWKGNDVNGTSISADYRLFPIPANALQSNPNLTQNPGY